MTRYTAFSLVGAGVDMQGFDLSPFHFATQSSSSEITFVDPSHPETQYVLGGTGFTFDPNDGHATAGIINQLKVTGESRDIVYRHTGLSLVEFGTYVKDNDWLGLRAALFHGNDQLEGTLYDDVLVLSDGGDDSVDGGSGNDTFSLGGALTARDQIVGGAGYNIVDLEGNYAAGIKFNQDTIVEVEELRLQSGFDYKITTRDANVAPGTMLAVNANELTPLDHLTFHGEAETDGVFFFTGGLGNDLLWGGAGSDTFLLGLPDDSVGSFPYGGSDRVRGGGGDDIFNFGNNFDWTDRIDGGTGFNTLNLAGDYEYGLEMGAQTLKNIQLITLAAGIHGYNLELNDAAVSPGSGLKIDGSALGPGQAMVILGDAETDGRLTLVGGQGNDRLYGGADTNFASDYFDLSHGGNDRAFGGGAWDTFFVGGALTAKDMIDGGPGGNELELAGDYSKGVTLKGANITNIAVIILDGAYNYKLATDDALIPADKTLLVQFHSSGKLTLEGGAESDARFVADGGDLRDNLAGGAGGDIFRAWGGNDNLDGGAGNDWLQGGTGIDTVAGGPGADIFAFANAEDSNHYGYDTITDFNWNEDKIALTFQITDVDDPEYADSLEDLPASFSATNLGVHHVALAKVGLDQAEFLVVDMNGVAGYQIGEDLLVSLNTSLGTPTVDHFIVSIILQSR